MWRLLSRAASRGRALLGARSTAPQGPLFSARSLVAAGGAAKKVHMPAFLPRRAFRVYALGTPPFPSAHHGTSRYFSASASALEDDVEQDKELIDTWTLTDAELERAWESVDAKKVGVLSEAKLSEVVRIMLHKQREKLRIIVQDREDAKEELEQGFISFVPRWKQWGITMQVEEASSELETAKELLGHLDKVDEAVDHVMAKVNPDHDDKITLFEFFKVISPESLTFSPCPNTVNQANPHFF